MNSSPILQACREAHHLLSRIQSAVTLADTTLDAEKQRRHLDEAHAAVREFLAHAPDVRLGLDALYPADAFRVGVGRIGVTRIGGTL